MRGRPASRSPVDTPMRLLRAFGDPSFPSIAHFTKRSMSAASRCARVKLRAPITPIKTRRPSWRVISGALTPRPFERMSAAASARSTARTSISGSFRRKEIALTSSGALCGSGWIFSCCCRTYNASSSRSTDVIISRRRTVRRALRRTRLWPRPTVTSGWRATKSPADRWPSKTPSLRRGDYRRCLAESYNPTFPALAGAARKPKRGSRS